MDYEVVAIYFPSWHPNPHYRAWYGDDFTEWELLKTAQPLFPGHRQPKIPTWGYFDESDPAWAAREIDLAADHGITTFLFDWYWYSGVRLMEEALEGGFLQAPNRQRLKFALMWANHDWGTWPAVTGIPGMHGETGVNRGQQVWLPSRHSPDDLDRVIDYCAEHYFSQPNYWTIDGKPHFVLWDIAKFTEQLGGRDAARAGLERMDARAQRLGLPGLYFTANVGCCNDNVYCCGYDRVPAVRELGFQSTFAYNIVRVPEEFVAFADEYPVVSYEGMIASHQHCWHEIEKWGVSHFPSVTVGSDVTPRWHRGLTLPADFRALAYEPIVNDNTPARFGRLCSLGLRQMAKNPHPRALIINAWNEWSEGMYLLPESREGTGYLEALKQAIEEYTASDAGNS